jgi:peptide/nickel transport system permease protein
LSASPISILAFPRLVLALALVAVLGTGQRERGDRDRHHRLAPVCAIARTETLTCRGSDFNARPQGAGPAHIAHPVGPRVADVARLDRVVRVTLDMAHTILTAAGLGFLGLGAQPPMSEWGAMIASGRQFIFDQWWVVLGVPGVAILFGSLAFNLVGDGLRGRALDPRHG